MKRLLFLLTLTFSITALAQEGPKISSAVIALDRNNDLKSAKEHIDEAAEIINQKGEGEVKYKDLRKFYFYNGKINLQIALSEKPEVQQLDEQALEKAEESLTKVISYEAKIGKDRYTDDAKQLLPNLAQLYAKRGIDAAQSENYDKAYTAFLKSYDMKEEYNMGTDTAMLYNAALMAQNAKNYDKATEILEQLINMEYKGRQYKVTVAETGQVVEVSSKREQEMAMKTGQYKDPVIEGDIRADVIVNTANLRRTMGDTVAYDSLVSLGREKFPKNEALLRAELQKFLETQEYDKAMVNLNQAIENQPENPLFYYIKGYILQTSMDSATAARDAYKKAIEQDEDYVEAIYMMGLSYVDEANELTATMNELPLNAKSKYNKLKEEQTASFEQALKYFRQAREADPDDMDTLQALKEVLYKLKKYEDAQEVQAEIDKRS